MKEDTGKFGYNARDWNLIPKKKTYDENYEKIFRKVFCQNCGTEVEPDNNKRETKNKYICYDCLQKYFDEAIEGTGGVNNDLLLS